MKTSSKLVTLAAITWAVCNAQVGFAASKHFATLEDLTSDIAGVSENLDQHLVNPWGLAPGPKGMMNVADNATGVVTRYDLVGNPLPLKTGSTSPLVVQLPMVSGSIPAAPTGLRLNHVGFAAAPDFVITSGTLSGNSHYLLVTEDGSIAGINESVAPDQAIVAVTTPNAVYKGLALGMSGSTHHLLYVANFNSGAVEVYDNQFQPASSDPNSGLGANAFVDPNPVSGYAPTNIKVVHAYNSVEKKEVHYVAVTYAQQDGDKHDPVLGTGLGYVNLFHMDGRFVKRLVDVGGSLNAPWGMAFAPRALSYLGGQLLLVGNFGDGTIHGFKLVAGPDGLPTGEPLAEPISYKDGTPVTIDGLQAIHFGRPSKESLAALLADPDDDRASTDLYFTAGLLGQEHGLFGVIRNR